MKCGVGGGPSAPRDGRPASRAPISAARPRTRLCPGPAPGHTRPAEQLMALPLAAHVSGIIQIHAVDLILRTTETCFVFSSAKREPESQKSDNSICASARNSIITHSSVCFLVRFVSVSIPHVLYQYLACVRKIADLGPGVGRCLWPRHVVLQRIPA